MCIRDMYKKPFIGMAIGGAAGGLYAGLMGVKAYVMEMCIRDRFQAKKSRFAEKIEND